MDDEDFTETNGFADVSNKISHGSTVVDKTTGEEEKSDHLTLIIIIAAVALLTLSVAAIVTIMLVRRRMHSRQQGVYAVPAEQDHKRAV